jgi:hypothetical protein
MQLTYEWGGARITVQSPTVRADNHAKIIGDYLANDDDALADTYDIMRFADCVTSIAAIEGDLAFAPPSRKATREELRASFEAWLDMPKAFIEAWERAYAQVLTGGNEHALSPNAPAGKESSQVLSSDTAPS